MVLLAAWRLPFVLHVAVESVAVFLFMCRPATQLGADECSPQARLVLRQYGALLLSSNLICLAVAGQSEPSALTRQIACALLVYHVFPCHRAWVRMQSAKVKIEEARKVSVLARPDVHLAVHIACFATMHTIQIMLAALLSILNLAIGFGHTNSPMRGLISRDGKASDAVQARDNTASASRMKSNAMVLGIPIQRVANLTIANTPDDSGGDDGNIITSGSKLHYSPLHPANRPAALVQGYSNASDDPSIPSNPLNVATGSGDGDGAPVPEYNDPGYRVRCLSPDDPNNPSDEERFQHEDYKKGFECWFYHRTRCFSGYLTSLDPRCKHDCSCEHNTWASYNASTKGNHGAGMAGVYIVLPVPEYSPEDGGCLG
ncbi:hypothetical protein Micbo1qcDRAFT_191830 [Microdochium bolleyi]|uniref:Uncharacterized protein n=1 Tax=Microdochium bolleyi TaxID=196109 RepID=A0A136JJJ5_9PEZI|nr:hypothetical protein Micbo1qcDRAFT_191830 [Microdochium bolleyi]